MVGSIKIKGKYLYRTTAVMTGPATVKVKRMKKKSDNKAVHILITRR